MKWTTLLILLFVLLYGTQSHAQLFQDDFGTGFAAIDGTKWPATCRGGTASSFNTSIGGCAGAGDYEYGLSGFGSYITTMGISIPATGYELTFDYSFNNGFGFPDIEIRTGATCGTFVGSTTALTNTSGTCTPQSINLDAYAGQTIYIRFVSNTSSATFYFDDVVVDASSGGGAGVCLIDDDFGSGFASIDATTWPAGCRGGTASGFNTSIGGCAGAGDYNYSLSGFGSYITSMALAIPSTGYNLDFVYSFSNAFGYPEVEIRTGGPCGTTLAATTTLTNTSGVCTPQSINLDAYAGQTIYIRFRANTSSASFYLDDVQVCNTGGGPSGDYKWADNFNDNNLTANYAGTDGDEACTGCSDWNLGGGASLELVPAGGWNGNSNETEAFTANMANVYYVKLDRNEFIESPTLDMSTMESFKISFYAKSSSPGTGGGDNWTFSDRLKLQIWDGTSWITVESMRDDLSAGWSSNNDFVSSALPFNYYCFTAYKSNSSPGNYYYNSAPNVDASYFHSDFKFRVIFEGGFSGSPFAWVDDFTFRADNDGYSTMIPCGLSFWNQPAATSYGQDTGTSGNNNAEKGVELELDNSINIPPLWASEADDGDVVDQVFGGGESERVVFSVISEQEINFAFPRVHFYAPSMGWQSSVMSIDNNYVGPGWKYYAVEYISCDLAGGSIAEPTDDYRYYFSFEYGNEFIPVFYHLNTSGIEFGGGVTSALEVFNAPDVTSTDNCGLALPVELVLFDVVEEDLRAHLIWETNSEINNDYFDIERSIDAVNFSTVGRVDGAGNSQTPISYSYFDTPSAGVTYYRLRQVDFDGAETLSETIAYSRGAHPGLVVYPNPATNEIVVLGADSNKAPLINAMDGKNVAEAITFTFSGDRWIVDVRTLSPGVYFVEVNGMTARFIRK